MAEIDVTHDPERRRYEARLAGEVAGFAEYIRTDELIIFTHTEVDPQHEGKGVGSAIAAFALEDVRAGGVHRVLPICPFIKAWIARHPDYHSLQYGVPASTAKD